MLARLGFPPCQSEPTLSLPLILLIYFYIPLSLPLAKMISLFVPDSLTRSPLSYNFYSLILPFFLYFFLSFFLAFILSFFLSFFISLSVLPTLSSCL